MPLPTYIPTTWGMSAGPNGGAQRRRPNAGGCAGGPLALKIQSTLCNFNAGGSSFNAGGSSFNAGGEVSTPEVSFNAGGFQRLSLALKTLRGRRRAGPG